MRFCWSIFFRQVEDFRGRGTGGREPGFAPRRGSGVRGRKGEARACGGGESWGKLGISARHWQARSGLRFGAFTIAFFHARTDGKTGGARALGAQARGWWRTQIARRFQAGHARSVEEDAQGGSEPIEALPAANRGVMSDSLGGGAADFPALLRRHGLLQDAALLPPGNATASAFTPTQATTILAFKFTGRRAGRGRSARDGWEHGGLRSRGQGSGDRSALDHGDRGRAGDGLGNGACARAFASVFSPDATPGDERGRQGARPLEIAAR